MSLKVFQNLKIKFLFVIFLILFFLNIYLIPVLALIDAGGVGDDSSFNPNNYEIDYSKKHELKKWKHEGGSVFSINSRLFYDIPGIKMVPCKSYQEWGNGKQLVKDAALIGVGFIPGAGNFVNFFYDKFEMTGVTDKWIDEKDDKIAMLNDIVYYELESDPGKGFFFFDLKQLENIKQVDIAFCDCEQYISCIDEIMASLNNEVEIDEKKLDPLKDIKRIIQIRLKRRLKEIIIDKINKRVGHKIARTTLKKAAKKTVGRFFGKILVPGIVNAWDKAEQIIESDNNLKQRINFNVTNNTIGFAIHFSTENELEIYELKENVNHQRSFHLVTRTNIANSDHMLVNLLKKKSFDSDNQSLNVYGGHLKGEIN
ncbi:hypothetical protein [Candidatus Phytoplasma sp. AldY-WA1]|uniref:hypothetical protein n=1 Tax=Candidatus Phytoplasma sp. AldY-WA1 TaxID=2852100 RepID=UPI00254FF6BE|nr:hypothetical protein [Candidatus Phytoplasma sp. AldY-WA1]